MPTPPNQQPASTASEQPTATPSSSTSTPTGSWSAEDEARLRAVEAEAQRLGADEVSNAAQRRTEARREITQHMIRIMCGVVVFAVVVHGIERIAAHRQGRDPAPLIFNPFAAPSSWTPAGATNAFEREFARMKREKEQKRQWELEGDVGYTAQLIRQFKELFGVGPRSSSSPTSVQAPTPILTPVQTSTAGTASSTPPKDAPAKA